MDKGYLVLTGETGTQEYDTYHCCHCQRMVVIRPGSGETRGFCRLCFAPNCGQPACLDKCVPFEKKLEEEAARAARKHDAW